MNVISTTIKRKNNNKTRVDHSGFLFYISIYQLIRFHIYYIMNLEEARQILRAAGKPTCSCQYGNSTDNMIQEAIKIKDAQQQPKP